MPTVDNNPKGSNQIPEQPRDSIEGAVVSLRDYLNMQIAGIESRTSDRSSSLAEAINIRLDGMDKAVDQFTEDVKRVPTETDRAISGLRDLIDEKLADIHSVLIERDLRFNAQISDMKKAVEVALTSSEKAVDAQNKSFAQKELVIEKFDSIQLQFKERDTRVEQTARDTKVAVDAALQAAEKAVGKQNEASSQAIAKSESNTTKQIDGMGVLIKTTADGTDSKIVDIKERLTRVESLAVGRAVEATEQIQQKTVSNGSTSVVISVLVGCFAFISIVISIATYLHTIGAR